MIVVLGDRDMGQEPGAGAAASNRVIRRRRCDDGVAGPAGELRADMPDHLEPARHIIERLGDILADPAQGAATGGGRRRARDASPPRAAGAPATCAGPAFALQWRPRRRCHDRRGRGEPLGLVGFQRFDRQLELLGFARQLLRRTAELGAPVSRQLEAQLGDLRLGGDCTARPPAPLPCTSASARPWAASASTSLISRSRSFLTAIVAEACAAAASAALEGTSEKTA